MVAGSRKLGASVEAAPNVRAHSRFRLFLPQLARTRGWRRYCGPDDPLLCSRNLTSGASGRNAHTGARISIRRWRSPSRASANAMRDGTWREYAGSRQIVSTSTSRSPAPEQSASRWHADCAMRRAVLLLRPARLGARRLMSRTHAASDEICARGCEHETPQRPQGAVSGGIPRCATAAQRQSRSTM